MNDHDKTKLTRPRPVRESWWFPFWKPVWGHPRLAFGAVLLAVLLLKVGSILQVICRNNMEVCLPKAILEQGEVAHHHSLPDEKACRLIWSTNLVNPCLRRTKTKSGCNSTGDDGTARAKIGGSSAACC